MEEVSTGVQKLEGEEILDWLRGPGVVTFRYQANKPGLWIMFGLGVIIFGIAAFLAYRTGLEVLVQKAAFSMLTVFGIWCWSKPARWGIFSMRNYVGLSSRSLLIGSGEKATVIALEQINPETVNLDDMQESLYSMVLPVEIGAFRTRVFLVGLYVHLKEFEAFMAEMLPRIAPDEPVDIEVDEE